MGDKQCRPRSDAAMRRLIWVYTVCSGLFGRMLMVNTAIPLEIVYFEQGMSIEFCLVKAHFAISNIGKHSKLEVSNIIQTISVDFLLMSHLRDLT